MKKSLKIILFISGILIVLGIYVGYMIYTISYGGESLSGEVEKIPVKVKPIPPITSGESDWTNWRGTDYKGKSLYKGIRPEWTGGLKKRWQVNYLCQDKSTASWAAPVIKGNRIVVPGRDEKNDIVFCLDAENGDLIWMGSYEAEAGESHGPGPRATPFIDEERVYSFGRSGDLVCWHLENGKMLWRKNVKDEGGEEPEWGFSSSPLVIGNRVVVQAGGNALTVAYDKLSGDLLWKSMKGRIGYAAAVPIRSEGEDRIIIYHGTGLSCLNSSDGRELWTLPWETDYGVNATTPLISTDTIFSFVCI